MACGRRHAVCTFDEARRLIRAQAALWVERCGCRDQRAACRRARVEVSLAFTDQPGRRPISAAEAAALLDEAAVRHLVARPFRSADGVTEGVCLCCDDCCAIAGAPGEPGALHARTDLGACSGCGACVDACHFGARVLAGGRLVEDLARCYGCGLCVLPCPFGCVRMVPRYSSR
jgi:ferredoxin